MAQHQHVRKPFIDEASGRSPRTPGRSLLPLLALAGVLSLAVGAARAEAWSLDSCVTVALLRNPELRAADRDVEAARARRSQMRALEPPVLSYEAGKLGTSISAEEREASWRLSQAFRLPTERSSAGRVANVEIAIAEAERESARLRVRGDVIRAYRRLQADLLLVRSLQSLRGSAVSIEELTNTRLGTGGARYLDVLRARIERVRIDNDLLEADRSLRENRRLLNALLARDPEASLDPADSLAFVPLSDSLTTVLSDRLASRPRLRTARLRLEREAAARTLGRRSLLPSAELSVGQDRVPGIDRAGLGASVGISLPFAPWTDRRGRVAEARALEGGAQGRLEATQRSLEGVLRSAYGSAETAQAQVLQFERVLVRDTEDAVLSAVRGYQYGQIDGTDLFEALRAYRTVQLEHIRALLDYHLALADLLTAE